MRYVLLSRHRIYMLALSSLSQFVVLLLATPTNFIPWFGDIAPDQFGSYMRNASICFAHAEGASDMCSSAATMWTFCVVTMLLSNLMQVQR